MKDEDQLKLALDNADVPTASLDGEPLNILERVTCLLAGYVNALRARKDAVDDLVDEKRDHAETHAKLALAREDIKLGEQLLHAVTDRLDDHGAPPRRGVAMGLETPGPTFTTQRIDDLVAMLREQADDRCKAAEEELAEITGALERCRFGDSRMSRVASILHLTALIEGYQQPVTGPPPPHDPAGPYTATIEHGCGDRRIRRTFTAASLFDTLQGIRDFTTLGASKAKEAPE